MVPKAVLLMAGLALAAAPPTWAMLPQTLDEMKAQYALVGTTPEGAVKAFIEACFVYMNPATRDVGRNMLQPGERLSDEPRRLDPRLNAGRVRGRGSKDGG